MGKLVVGRIMNGTLRANNEVLVVGEKENVRGSIKKLFVYEGLKRVAVNEASSAGEVIAIAGLEVGHHRRHHQLSVDAPVALPRIVVEEPTIKMRIGVNTLAVRQGQVEAGEVSSPAATCASGWRKEALKNLAIRVEMTESPDTFMVLLGRGELQLAILVETMRREGYEMQLSNPEVVTREIDGAGPMEPLGAGGGRRARRLRGHRHRAPPPAAGAA